MTVEEFIKDFEAKLKESENLRNTNNALKSEELIIRESIAKLKIQEKEAIENFNKLIIEQKKQLAETQNNHARVISQEDIRISKQNIESDTKKQEAEKLLSEAKQKSNLIIEERKKLDEDFTRVEKEKSKLNIDRRNFEQEKTVTILQAAQCKQDIEKLVLDKKEFSKEKEDVANTCKYINEETRKNNIILSESKNILAETQKKAEENKNTLTELEVKNAAFGAQNESLDARKRYLDKKEENLKAKEANLDKLQQEAAFCEANAQKKEREAEDIKKQLAFEIVKLKKKEK